MSFCEIGKTPKITKLADIDGGKIEFRFQARVVNLWTTPERFSANEICSMHMILLDDHVLSGHFSIELIYCFS
jgi:hypothetical protein